MTQTIKTSPLCSRDQGREIYFTAMFDGRKRRLTAPRDLLDDVCGDAATEADRKKWVADNKGNCLALLENSTNQKPFDRIRVEEIS